MSWIFTFQDICVIVDLKYLFVYNHLETIRALSNNPNY